MNLKSLADSLFMLAIIAAGAYGVYYFLNTPDEQSKASARYKENEQETRFDQIEDASGSLDDCYRYTDPNSIEACIERRTNQELKE